ncbi:unnamed protein product, partial [Oppiella nova]
MMEAEYINSNGEQNNNNKTGSKLTQDQIFAQALTYFLAGTKTTSTVLAFCTYVLAVNPDCQQRLYDEIQAITGNQNGDIGYETLDSMPYLDACVSETLRLYSPFPRVKRVANTDYTFPGIGLTIKAGQRVEIPVHAMHRSPDNFVDPDKFNPD